MERSNEDRPMIHGCKPPKCIGKFKDEFKIYDVCCRIVVKVCSKCGFEYEPHLHHMCPRCRYCGPGGHGPGGHGPGGYGPGGYGLGGYGLGGYGPGGYGPGGCGPGGYGSGGYGLGIFGPGGFQPGGMVYKGIKELLDDDDDD